MAKVRVLKHVREGVPIEIEQGDLITLAEAARLAKVHVSHIAYAVAKGDLPSYTLPGDPSQRKFTDRASVLAWAGARSK